MKLNRSCGLAEFLCVVNQQAKNLFSLLLAVTVWQVLFSPRESVCQFHHGRRRHLPYFGNTLHVVLGRFCQHNNDIIEKKTAVKAVALAHST